VVFDETSFPFLDNDLPHHRRNSIF
jgi:hypothetical protein